MKSLSLVLVIAMSVSALSGCGTIANFATMKPQVYGGIAQDVKFFSNLPPDRYGFFPGGQEIGTGTGGLIALAVIMGVIPAEFCCTAIGDTLTLPITIPLDEYGPLRKKEPIPVSIDAPAQLTAGATVAPNSTSSNNQ